MLSRFGPALVAAALIAGCADNTVAPTPTRGLAPSKAHLDVSVAPPTRFAGNGHYYEAISSHLNFHDAVNAAAARQFGGCTSAHLATITSAEEDVFVGAVFAGGGAWWIGGFQPAGSPEPAGNWSWITGEPFVYTNWRNSGEPNNSGGFENAMYMNTPNGAFVDFDENRGFDLEGYIVEYEGCPNHFVSDTFDGTTVDPNLWTVVLSPLPGGSPSVVQHDGAIFLTDRAHLHTAQQYNPRGGVHVTGEWTMVGGGEDVLQILTRSSGVPAGQFGETSFGIGFNQWSATSEAHNAFGIGGDNFTSTGSLTFLPGITYLFDVTDDGFNLTFTLTNKGNPSESITGHATSTFVAPTNYVTFHNRESCCDGTHVAKLDNVVIDQLPVRNSAPIANAGGPYTAIENSPITLSAAGSSDPDGDALTYEWDLDNNGSYETSSVTATTTFTSAGTKVVGLKVTDAAGASSTTTTTVIVSDPTPPSIVANVPAATGNNGWYTSAVTVSFTVTDPESPASLQTTNCGPTTVSADTQSQQITCTATSDGGTSTKTVTVKLDATKPVIAYAGAQATYTVDQTINITCSASDATSGLASNTCAPITGRAYGFSLGAHTFSATATDNAGNTRSASVTFTVVATAQSMPSVITALVSGQSQDQLLNRMRNIADKLDKHNPSVDEQIKNFVKEVGKALDKGDVTAANAAILIALVQSLN